MTSFIIPLPFVILNLESVESKGKNYKNRVWARNFQFGPLDTNWEFLSFAEGGLGTYSDGSQWDLGQIPKHFLLFDTYKALESI